MRASFMLLGPLLTRFGRVIISNPGGDRIGRRPVDLHVEAMRALGASIEYRNGYYFATAPGRLRGAEIRFPLVSVMGTENAMLAATLAEGHTVIRPAAQEPEVDDLIAFLQDMGAAVERTYPDTIEIEGRKRLRGADHRVLPDRIETGTFVVAAAVTGGRVTLENAPVRAPRRVHRDRSRRSASASPAARDTIEVDGSALHAAGYRAVRRRDRAVPRPRDRPSAADLASSSPRPTGVSHIHEAIFEDRLEYLSEVRRMGATRPDASTRTMRPSPGPPSGRRGSRDRRPAGRRLADPGRARGRGNDHDPRRAPRSPGL